MEETKPYRPLGWTTPDESKRLVELGLSTDTCDLWYAERFTATWNETMNRYEYSETPYYYLSFAKPSETNCSVDFINRVANTRDFSRGIQRRLFTKFVFLSNYSHFKL